MKEAIKSKWTLLGEYFSEQLKTPLKHPEFIFYFLFILIGFGAVGVWTTLGIESNSHAGRDDKNIILSIIGYGLPIIAAGSVDLIFTKEKYLRNSIKIIAFSMVPIGILLLFLCFQLDVFWGYVCSIFGCILSWVIWWIANAENANLIDNTYYDEMSQTTENLGRNLTDLENGK